MNRKLWLVVPLLLAAVACPGDKNKDTAVVPVDSAKADSAKAAAAATADTATDLSKVVANVPKVNPDTFKVRNPPANSRVSGGNLNAASTRFPDAPAPLVEAVQREQGATRFCFTEFGQKSDPSLRGNVAMLVTISNAGVSDARVADSRWTGTAGRAVNRCLDEKAKQAWNVSRGAVRPGKYVVQLSFSGAQ
jgi:hypothetical protein